MIKKYCFLCLITSVAYAAQQFRIESDSFGQVQVPADRYYGAQTQRALEHFAIGNQVFNSDFIHAYALSKKASATIHARHGYLPEASYKAIVQAADEIIAGKFDDHFPVHIWQNAGTQTNMNVNEVIANRANELLGSPLGSKKPVHPNDHVNLGQSTNDTFPTALNIAVALATTKKLLPAIDQLIAELTQKSVAFNDIIKTGRTHMQDAVPLSLGQEFSAYVTQVSQARARIVRALEDCYELPLGGTAIGTGITAYAGYDIEVAAEIARLTGLPFITAQNKFAGIAAHDSLVAFSGALKSLACALFKMGYDLRILSSGPRTGIGELHLPENEPGSSIMPGKINPSQCEALRMVCAYVMGNDVALSWCCALGDLQLNIYGPLMAYSLLQSIDVLADGCTSFAKYCISGIQPNRERIAYLMQQSLSLVTALSPKIGYDKAAHVAHTALKENKALKQVAVELGYVTNEEYDQLVDPKSMLQPKHT